MAQVTNTFETFDAVGNREELFDKIYNIDPDETPFLSLIGRKKIASVHPEWQNDTLAAPDTDNNQPEGNDWTYSAVTPTTRVGNYAQISNKTVIISETQEVVDKAGRKSEMAYQSMKKLKELKIDQEVILLSNQASSAGSGNGATNRKLGGFRAWLASNDSLGTNGASGGFNSGTGVVDAATNGDQRAFTKALLDGAILSAYNNGGKPTTCILSPYNKTVFSTFLDDANVVPLRKEVRGKEQAVLIGAADMYLSDFGLIAMVPNRQMAIAGASIARNVFLIDPEMVEQGVLRPAKMVTPAQTGDAEKRVWVTEYTLVVKNEAAHAVVADTYGLSAAS